MPTLNHLKVKYHKKLVFFLSIFILTFTLMACAETPIPNRSNDFRGCGSGASKTTEAVTTASKTTEAVTTVGLTPSATKTTKAVATATKTTEAVTTVAWTPTPTATPIPPLPADLLAQGYTLAEVPPVLQWDDVTYEVELYVPPFGAKRMVRHLFVFKRQNGQGDTLSLDRPELVEGSKGELLERVASPTLALVFK